MGATADRQGVIVNCPSCGRANRMRFGVLGKTSRCGHCRTALPPPSSPIEIGDSTVFDAASKESAIPLLVDFWAPWCGPCRMVAPELEKVTKANAGRFVVVKVNTDAVPDVAGRFRIRSIPTLALIAGGRELDRLMGAHSARDIEAFVSRTLEASTKRAS